MDFSNLPQLLSDNVSAIVAAISVIVSLITFIITTGISNKREFIKTFDQIYQITFALRTSISNDKLISDTIEDFHYELDTILNSKPVETKVLNYLTEVENLSLILLKKKNINRFSIRRFSYSKIFNRLSSAELYKRMMCLYPYITYKRIQTGNYEMFSNYTELLNKIERCEKSKNQLKTSDKIFIGLRDSDIDFEQDYYHDSICIFSKRYEEGFCDYRANQNFKVNDFTSFYAKKIKDIACLYKSSTCKDYSLVFYNQKNAYDLPQDIRSHVACCNSESILHVLNDKARMKRLLSKNSIDVAPYCILCGCSIQQADQIYKNEKFIVQKTHGGGGIGTYLLDKNLLEKYKNSFQNNGRYIISKYIQDSISVNTHIIVSDNSNLVTPGSVQIIENIDNQLMYRGADFISYRELPLEIRERIRLLSIKIANILRENGYSGIAGIDFLIDKNNKIYCSEINPRFQASSIIISKYLNTRLENMGRKADKDLIFEPRSLHHINEDAFNGIIKSSISYYDEIDYSCYFYYNDAELSKENVAYWLSILYKNQNANSSNKIVAGISEDSFGDFDESLFNDKSYLFRVIYNTKITQISHDHTLWINDNIKLNRIPIGDLSMKISLLNQGVRLSDNLQYLHVKKAVFGGVDYRIIEKNMYINSPTGFGLYQLSPFEIAEKDNQFYLYFYKKPLYQIEIEEDYWTKSNDNSSMCSEYKDIIYISSDRLRIKVINGCDLKSCGTGCKFCEVPFSKCHYSLKQIEDAIKYSTKFDYHHILIGGGTDISEESWGKIIQIARIIKRLLPDKSISLMSIPAPYDKLVSLHKAGIDDVAFNIEIYDDELAEYYMPGKRDNNYDYYYRSLKQAVGVFGTGNVRTSFIVGLESTLSLIEGVKEMCEAGIIPSLSVFRPLPNTILFLNPPNNYLKEVYLKTHSLATKYNLFIGPKCDACKNNMLAI